MSRDVPYYLNVDLRSDATAALYMNFLSPRFTLFQLFLDEDILKRHPIHVQREKWENQNLTAGPKSTVHYLMMDRVISTQYMDVTDRQTDRQTDTSSRDMRRYA